MCKVQTEGSIWWFDESAKEYRRTPLTPEDRLNPKWGGPEAGPLEDNKWHPYNNWWIGNCNGVEKLCCCPHLMIDNYNKDNTKVLLVRAPMAKLEEINENLKKADIS